MECLLDRNRHALAKRVVALVWSRGQLHDDVGHRAASAHSAAQHEYHKALA